MATMCEKCYEVDTRKYKFGRTCKHCGGLLVQIDEMILPAISLLNKKGYHTKFCCSGHTYDSFPPYLYFEPYICFERYVKLPCLPDGFRYERDCAENRFVVRKNMPDDCENTYKHMEILKSNLALIEWATELPQHESNIL